MDNLKPENKKIIDICDLFVKFKDNIESLFSIIKIEDASQKIERLSIFDIPQEIRQLDPNLKYQPTHKLTFEGKDTSIFLGDNVIGFDSSKCEKEDIDFISTILESLKDEIESINRIGIKRTFNIDSIDNFLELKIKNNDSTDDLKKLSQIQLKEDNWVFNIISAEKNNIAINNNKKTSGYIVDIIVFYENLENCNCEEAINKISQLYSLQEEKYKKITK
ncbi:hypothetical protein ACLWVS_000159 [Campylobacter jejuni]|uniref:hypothetical protein n=1 Tax=Campylobacter jejuni TaxID=197 RepID=UPI0005CDDE2E|nr:hypothetical protein [Campylobacter jejuni]ELE7162783.1 hypothetical protein [Campylobacter jejuni]ELN6396881.1 hypothetical protein [Campylobacter jejuni]KJD23961.1 hypothetical protein TM41_02540 [Campylobacter jejuni subsp. jejuni]RTJ43977.1 hypothetical protein C3H73_01215 [Campylobacter jejuni]